VQAALALTHYTLFNHLPQCPGLASHPESAYVFPGNGAASRLIPSRLSETAESGQLQTCNSLS